MILYLAHLGVTLFMTGLIWFVQVVHYPLFAQVGDRGYGAYQTAHMRRTTWVVGPPMLLELMTGVALVSGGSDWLEEGWAWVNLAALGVTWLSTALLQSPAHQKLTAGFAAAPHERLVRGNWLRTALWTARSMLLLALLARRI